jgi:hypothetical protein
MAVADAEHPSEVMRRAASRLRELSGTATPAPWRVSYIEGIVPVVDGPNPDGHLVAETCRCRNEAHQGRARGDAGLITVLRNSAEDLAGLLEAEADRAGRTMVTDKDGTWCLTCGGLYGHNCGCWDAALATARAILGEADGDG